MPLPFEHPPLMPDETLQGFVARVAGMYETSFKEYCGLVGIRVHDLLAGRQRAVSRIAAMTGIPEATLAHHAFVFLDSTMAVYRGQMLDTRGLRRLRLYGCPACLQSDIAASPHAPEVAAWFRGAWFVRAVRTCPVHDLGLVPLSPNRAAYSNIDLYDSVTRLGAALADLGGAIGAAPSRRPSGLETYVIDRLAGEGSGGPLLDAMPLQAAVRTCEVVGAVSLFGAKAPVRTLDDDDRRAAAGVGFDVVEAGAESLRSLLFALQRQYRRGRSHNGKTRDVFGHLYGWLNGIARGADYDAIRRIVREHILDTMPVDLGKNLFGAPVAERRVHSTLTACHDGRTVSKRLSRELTTMGVLTDGLKGDRHLTLHRSAEEVDAIRAALMAGLSKVAAAAYLSITKQQFQRLVLGGLVKPLVPKDASCRTHSRFAVADLDEFKRRIDLIAPIRPVATSGTRTVAEVSFTTCVSMVHILDLMFAGRLRGASRLPNATGYASILIDPVAFMCVDRAAQEDLTFAEAARRMQVNAIVPPLLVEAGCLRTIPAGKAVKATIQRYVTAESFRAFRAGMVSLPEVSKAHGVHHATMLGRLTHRGIEPAIRCGVAGVNFYHRSDVDALARTDRGPPTVRNGLRRGGARKPGKG